MIRILLIDDQPLIRAGLRGILAPFPDITVAEAGDGEAALRHLEQGPIDVVLMDIRMPTMGGVETTRQIRRVYGPETPRILVLTTFEDDETVVDAIKAGADGFLSKAVEPDDLLTAVRALAEGNAVMSTGATEALIRHVATVPTVPAPRVSTDVAMLARFESLTPREREIVRAVADGHTHDAIAQEEHISRYTVKTHINRAMQKVGASDRAQLVAFAHRAGLFDAET